MQTRILPVFLLCACSATQPPPPAAPAQATPTPALASPEAQPEAQSPLLGEAVAGLQSDALRSLFADHFEWVVRSAPTWATNLGDHRFDDRLERRDAATLQRERGERRAFLARAQAIDTTRLNEHDRINLALLSEELAAAVEADVCESYTWTVSARENPFAGLSYALGEGHIVRSVSDGKNLLARLAQVEAMFADEIANLRTGVAQGRVAAKESVRRTVDQLDQELNKPSEAWAFMLPSKVEHKDWPADELASFRAQLKQLVEERIRPAVTRYRDLLRDEVLPHGRVGAQEGLSGLPDGAACYRANIRGHLSSARAPEELHALGLAQIAESDRQLAALGKKLFKTRTLADTLTHLRGDKDLYFKSREEILQVSEQALAAAKAELPKWFSMLPKAECIVREIPAHEAPYTTIAYYQAPNYDGSKPGEYYVNTYKPETRTRYDFRALTHHESIPGHHLQLALAQELGAIPLYLKLSGSTAFVEGWALYTERLGDEMGLYTSDLDRMGMWSYDAWRGARLVVDTGLHALGWTREQAEKFMLEHTALTKENISNEVDRYLSTPGQALAYKVGQIEILNLRAEAREKLGERFDIRTFHAVVLGAGAVSLPVLRGRVEAWVREQGAR